MGCRTLSPLVVVAAAEVEVLAALLRQRVVVHGEGGLAELHSPKNPRPRAVLLRTPRVCMRGGERRREEGT